MASMSLAIMRYTARNGSCLTRVPCSIGVAAGHALVALIEPQRARASLTRIFSSSASPSERRIEPRTSRSENCRSSGTT